MGCKLKLTHGLITENEHEGIKRGMSLQRFADKQIVKYLISIETTSADGQVVKTPIQFSEFGFQMFCTFMENAPHDLDNFPITDATS